MGEGSVSDWVKKIEKSKSKLIEEVVGNLLIKERKLERRLKQITGRAYNRSSKTYKKMERAKAMSKSLDDYT